MPILSHQDRFQDRSRNPKPRSLRPAFLLGFCVAAALLAAGCATTKTKFERTWKDPAFQPGSYKHVLVVGIGRKLANVQRLEQAFAENIGQHGAQAILASPLKSHDEKWTEAELRELVGEQNVDAVLLS